MSDAFSLLDFEPDFLTAVIHNAAAEAQGVGHLLQLWNIQTPSESGELRPKQFAREFYLALGVGLRFRVWESNQTCFHLDAGLPRGNEVILAALRLLSGHELEQMAVRLNIASLRLFHDHFVWVAKNELAVDLAFHAPLDDEQWDALADFIYDHRNALNQGDAA